MNSSCQEYVRGFRKKNAINTEAFKAENAEGYFFFKNFTHMSMCPVSEAFLRNL